MRMAPPGGRQVRQRAPAGHRGEAPRRRGACPARPGATMLLVQPITVRHFSDPGCPWAYSASPGPRDAALALRRPARLAPHAHRPDRARPAVRRSRLHAGARRPAAIALPPSTACRSRPSRSTMWPPRPAPAARSSRPPAGPRPRVRGLPRAAVRQFTTPLVLDEEGDLAALARRRRARRAGIVGAHRRPRRRRGLRGRPRAARTAEGSPTHFQGKAGADRRPRPLYRARR